MVNGRGRGSNNRMIGSSSRNLIVLTFLCCMISLVTMHDNIITITSSYYPIQKLISNQHDLLIPTIYNNITAMPEMISSGHSNEKR